MYDRADKHSGELRPAAMAPAAATRPPTLRSADLLRGSREITIEHEGECYRLRCTSKGKLILTK